MITVLTEQIADIIPAGTMAAAMKVAEITTTGIIVAVLRVTVPAPTAITIMAMAGQVVVIATILSLVQEDIIPVEMTMVRAPVVVTVAMAAIRALPAATIQVVPVAVTRRLHAAITITTMRPAEEAATAATTDGVQEGLAELEIHKSFIIKRKGSAVWRTLFF